ncbi:MAG: conjugal transfer protein TraX [Lachnospiraceae bacterium]|jgi:hypothetical protein|nr:conjugal transfer protein TraX [Lachnospiraceae bacterium]
MNRIDKIWEACKCLSGSSLKIIAVTAMLIDHIGLGIWLRLPEMEYLVPEQMDFETWFSIYRIMRNIGRLAFPIFCFLLVEGFFHTKSHAKYALRLFIFALLSQYPFRYAFWGFTESLNIFYTLLIAFMAMWGMEEAKKRYPARVAHLLLWFLIVTAAGVTAHLLNTDYSYRGVALVLTLYLFRPLGWVAQPAGYVAFSYISQSWRVATLPGFILPLLYNGKRGWGVKYLFYVFYPAHLLIIYWVWRFWL